MNQSNSNQNFLNANKNFSNGNKNISDSNQNISSTNRALSTIDLTSALDQSVEAASKLHLTETELIALLLEHLHPAESCDNVVYMSSEGPKRMFNPEAGP